jgi:hypothetical protein
MEAAGILDVRERELVRRRGRPTRNLPVRRRMDWRGPFPGPGSWRNCSGAQVLPADLEASILDGRYREQRSTSSVAAARLTDSDPSISLRATWTVVMAEG